MKKDIQFLPVSNVTVAIVRENEELPALWRVYIINNNDHDITSITISSNGYGKDSDGNDVQTSTLKYHIGALVPNKSEPIEIIDDSVFHLFNEYWVSYFVGNQIYDKRFIFVPGSIVDQFMIDIPLLGKKGIVHS